jgi:Na+/melibiose symporter-like transporter
VVARPPALLRCPGRVHCAGDSFLSGPNADTGTRAGPTLSNGKLLAYALPALPIAAVGAPLAIYLPPFYATEMGLGLTAVGTVMMAARFWDLFTDPLMGVLSDKLPSRWGRRRHWMVAALPLLLVSAFLVMFPGWFVGEQATVPYLLGSLFLLYIGYTMLPISHLAWGAELSPGYHERSRIQGWREFAHLSSMVLVLLIPAVLEQTGYALSADLKVAAMGWYIVALGPLAIAISVVSVGERPGASVPPVGLRKSVAVLLSNRFMARIVLADVFIAVPGAVRSSVYIFYITAIIGAPEWAAIIMLSYFVAGPIAVPLWLWIGRRVPKHRAAALGVFLHVVVSACYLIPGEGDELLFAALFFSSGIVYAGVPFLLRSMTADVVDYDRLETGQDRTGLYFSLVTTTSKVGGALGIGLGYPLLAWIGFDPAAATHAQAHLDGLRYVYAFVPVVSELLVVALLYGFPLDERMQREIRARLDASGAGGPDGRAGR